MRAAPIQDSSRALGRAALSRWTKGAARQVQLAFGVQLLAAAGWIGFAWGVGCAVEAIAQGRSPRLCLLVALASIAGRTGLVWWSEAVAAEAGRASVAAARREILDAVSRFGSGLLGGAGSGGRTSQIVDRTAKLAPYAANWMPGVRLAVAGPLLVLVAVAAQSWLAAALLVVSVLVMPVFLWITLSQTSSAARAQQDALDRLSGAFQARAAHAGLIRAFRSVGRERAAIETAAQDLRVRTMAILRIAFLSTATLEFFSSISIALVAVYVGFKLLGLFPFSTGETVTLAEGLTALILAPEFFAPIRRLSTLHHDRADGVAAAAMLASWLDARSQIGVTRLAKLDGAPRIRFSDVALSHDDGRVPVVSGVAFEVEPGEIIALAGPSGSGKTTCLLALIGRATVLAGAILVNGKPLRPGESLAEGAAFLRQAPWVSEGTLAENITLARRGARRRDIEAAAEAAGVLDFAHAERGALDQRLERFGSGLSGGQRQRLALARAVLRDAPLWLLDEPTAHLDPDAEAAFLARLPALARGRTVIIATHAEAVMRACDRVVDMPARVIRKTAA
jgi:ATP-binding cassette subfamily C protein CydD